MTEKPDPPTEDKEAEARFNETLGRLVNTPHQPHKPATPKREPKPS